MKLVKNPQHNFSAPIFWKQFFDDFQLHASDINELGEWSQSEMFILHLQLLLNNDYVEALKKAENKTNNRQYLITSIFESDFLHVKLNSISPDRSLPLHDHPGTSGSMMVISGKVQAIACEQEKPNNNNQARNQLKIVSDTILSTGDSNCFTKTQNNIHSIKALTEPAVIIMVHVNPFAETQQSYFFPVSSQTQPNTHIMTQRVRAQNIQNFHQNLKETSYETNIKENIM